MIETLVHRGPDAGGIWVDEEAGLAVGHRRLAIIDLSENGAQPMFSTCGRYVLVFNGEIYNHLELRRQLDQFGAPVWRGTSDTETLLACFALWGVAETLKRAVGMFALALWDRTERRLTLARDRFGEKPLYYGWVGPASHPAFVFGSELKALRACGNFDNPIDRGSVALFLRFCVVPSPYSIYANIHKLDPGCILTLDCANLRDRTPRIDPYWELAEIAMLGLSDPLSSETKGMDALEAALREAIALQMVADVPVGAFLSGGIDSSTVVALMQQLSSRPVNTFTIGFDEAGFDEAPHAAAVARHLGTEHHEVRVSPEETREMIPQLPLMYDEPFADSSQIPTAIICRVARASVTVALTGDGGDELFGGYNRYTWGPQFWRRVGWLPPSLRRLLGFGVRQFSVSQWNSIAAMTGLNGRVALLGHKAHRMADRLAEVQNIDELFRSMVMEWTPQTAPARLAPRNFTRLDSPAAAEWLAEPAHRMMFWDSLTYLPDDILTKVDRASMASSLETRVPMLDHRVAAVAWRMPLHMKIRGGRTKWALRQVLYRYVPKELIERPKAGFAIPVGQWLRGPLRDWAESLIEESRLLHEGFLDPKPIRNLWCEHLEGHRDWTVRLWNVLMFQSWLEAVGSVEKRLVQPEASSHPVRRERSSELASDKLY